MTTEMNAQQKETVKKAKGSASKKVLWWTLGTLGVIVVVVTLVLLLVKDKKGQNPVTAIIQKTKKEVDKADVEAKVEAAKAAGVEEAKIDEIKRTLEIDDADERRQRLADLI